MSYTCNERRAILHSISALCSHLQIIHSFNVLSIYTCAQDGCSREYDSVKSFKKHLKIKHPIRPQLGIQVIENVLPENVIIVNRENVSMDDNFPMPINENVHNNLQGNPNIRQFHEIVLNFKNLIYQSSLALVAKLYNDITLNRTQVQNILDYIKQFASSGFLEMLRNEILTVVRNNNIPQEEIENVDTMFAALYDMFLNLESETQRVNALEQSDCYVGPNSYYRRGREN